MTLGRQLFLLVFVMFLLIVCGTLVLSLQNTRAFLDQQLESHAQDTATSLGLSLSQQAALDDAVVYERMVDAIFKRGYYREISFVDIQGRPLVQRELAPAVEGVPQWFIHLLPLSTPRAEALVMSGWSQLGHVYVQSHPGYAYLELWNSARHTLLWSALSLLMASLGVALLMRRLLRPLRAVEAQAHAIENKEFPVLEEVPRTRELRRVVSAMNSMTRHVERMLGEQTALAEHLRREAYADSVTGLANRRHFEDRLRQLLASTEEAGFGAVMLMQVAGLEELNREQGHAAGDEYLCAIATAVRQVVAGGGGSLAARFAGAEFACLLPGVHGAQADASADALLQEVQKIRAGSGERAVCHVGIAMFSGEETTKDLFAQADMALRRAQSSDDHRHRYDPEVSGILKAVHGADEWRRRLTEVTEQRAILLNVQPALAADGSALHGEVLARIHSQTGKLLNAGIFMPMAEHLGLHAVFDRLVVETLATQLARTMDAGGDYAVNLSPGSLLDGDFMNWLLDFVAGSPVLAKRLAVEVPEHHVVQDVSAFKAIRDALRERQIGFGIDQFGIASVAFGYLQSLRPDYVKIDGSLVRDIDRSKDNQFFLRVLTDIARGLEIRIIASYVDNQADLERVKLLGVDGVQGYFIAKPAALADGG